MVRNHEAIWVDNKPGTRRGRDTSNSRFDLTDISYRRCYQVCPRGRPDGGHRSYEVYRVRARFRIVYDANTAEVGDNFLEQLQPLATYFILKRCKPSNVAPRMRQTRNKSLPHRIVYNQENDWCCFRRVLNR